jgi:xylulokinase
VFAVGAAAALLDVPDGPVRLTGGGARSALVPQLLADVLGRPVRPLRLRSASAVGAALLAARGLGVPIDPRPEAGEEIEPRADARLTSAHERWRTARGDGLSVR